MNYLNQVPAAAGAGESPCTSWEDSAGPGRSQRPRAEPAGCPPRGARPPASAPAPLGPAPAAGYLLPLYQREGRPVPRLSSHLLLPCASPAPSLPFPARLLKPRPSCRTHARCRHPSRLYSELNLRRQNRAPPAPCPEQNHPRLRPSHDTSPPLPVPPLPWGCSSPAPCREQRVGPRPGAPGLPCSLPPSSRSAQLRTSRLQSGKKRPSAL